MPKLLRHLLLITFLTIGSLVFFRGTSFAESSVSSDFALQAWSGSGNGTVTLHWNNQDYVESYNIAYGPSSGNYLYGVTNVGDIDSYTIGGLTPGQTYYFVLSPIDDGNAMAYTIEVSAVASGKASAVTTQTPPVTPVVTTQAQPSIPTTQPVSMNRAVSDPSNFNLAAMSGPASGTVTLYWDNKGYTDGYNIAYGQSAGNYLWGVIGTGHVGQFTIGGLTPGQTYYFVLSGVDDNSAIQFTPSVSAVAAK